jgi:hypothetical protein
VTEHDNVRPLHEGLFARDGHLTMLTLDRFEVGELPTSMVETVIDHVESCDVCSGRLASMRIDDLPVLEPPAELLAQAHGAKPSRWGPLAIAGTVAAAAALLLMALPEPQQAERAYDEEAHLTASPYTTTAELEGAAVFAPALDVSIADARSGDQVEHGDRVAWDTALTLHVSPHEAGFVAVVSATELSHDASDDAADTDGGGPEHEVQVLMPVTALEARSGPHALRVEHANRFAPDVAEEQLMAIFCEDAFDLDDPFDPALPSLREDCTSVEFTLTRFGEVADS